MRVVSFDVFDTLLTRTFAVARDLFVQLGAEVVASGLVTVTPEEFARRRVAAEVTARQSAPRHEVQHQEIYTVLQQVLGLDDQNADRLREMELHLEELALQPVPGMAQRVAQERTRADLVLFISDMYLPTALVKKLLARHGFFQEGDRIYLSGEARASKAAGTLFQSIRRELPTSPVSWKHIGDNERADLISPRAEGIDAELVTTTRLNRYELLARGREDFVSLWRSRLAGTMRLVRLDCPEADTHQRVVWECGSNVVGPLWFAFVEWCLDEASKRGVKRLYFVARDGQIMHRIAERIVAARKTPIECRYLYGSRQAWHPASIDRFSKEDLEWLLAPTRFLSVEQVLERVGLSADDFAAKLKAAGLSESIWKQNLTRELRTNLGNLLLTPELARAIEVSAEAKRKLVLRYLEQENFFDGTPRAVVDIGWNGNMQRSLAKLLFTSGRTETSRLTGFYFGLRTVRKFSDDQVLVAYWPHSPESHEDIRDENGVMFELFAAADHGSVVGYQAKDGRILPLMEAQANEAALNWGLISLQEAVLKFTDTWLAHQPAYDYPQPEFHSVTREIYRLFYEDPTQAEALAWAAFPYSTDQIERYFEGMIPQWTAGEILRALINPERRPVGWWMEGTLSAYPSLLLACYLKMKRTRVRCRRAIGKRSDHPS